MLRNQERTKANGASTVITSMDKNPDYFKSYSYLICGDWIETWCQG